MARGVALVLLDLWLFFVAWPPREFNTQSGYKSNSSFDHVSGSSHLMVSGLHFRRFIRDNSWECKLCKLCKLNIVGLTN